MPCNTHNVNMKVKYTNCKADCLLALKEREKKMGEMRNSLWWFQFSVQCRT